jgi:hypothetical protein
MSMIEEWDRRMEAQGIHDNCRCENLKACTYSRTAAARITGHYTKVRDDMGEEEHLMAMLHGEDHVMLEFDSLPEAARRAGGADDDGREEGMSEPSISTALRTLADTNRRSHSVNPAILREAADEIDRLRGEIGKVSRHGRAGERAARAHRGNCSSGTRACCRRSRSPRRARSRARHETATARYTYALTADPDKPLREAREQIARLTAERDEARREVCVWQGLDTATKSNEVARVRGWDCFKEDGK